MIKKIILSILSTIIIITIISYSYTRYFYPKQSLITNINLYAKNSGIPIKISDISFNILSGISLHNVSFSKKLPDSNIYLEFNFPLIKVSYNYLSLLLHRKLVYKDIIMINPAINITTQESKSEPNIVNNNDKISKLIFNFLLSTMSNMSKNQIIIKNGSIVYKGTTIVTNILGSIYNYDAVKFSLYGFLNKKRLDFYPVELIFNGNKLEGKLNPANFNAALFKDLFKEDYFNEKVYIKIQPMIQYIYNNNFFLSIENHKNIKLIKNNNIYNFVVDELNNIDKIELVNIEAIDII